MYSFLMAIHVTACVLMILVVLLQAGRGAGLSMFGGGGSEQLFNAPTTTGFMKQLTTGLAVTFAITSLLLTLMHGHIGMSSVVNSIPMPSPVQQSAPPQSAPAQAPSGVAAPAASPAGTPAAAPAPASQIAPKPAAPAKP